MDSSEDDKDVRAREGCRWCWPTGLFAFALLVVPPPVEAQQPYRFWLAAQYNWEAKTGFYLNFENTTEGGQPCRLDRLSLILGVGDGGQWRFLSTPSRWQFDREYSVRGVIAPDRLELWLDEEKVAASEGRLKGWEGPITACHIPGWANAPAEYIIRQRSLGVAGSGERRIGLNLEDEASRPLALLLFEPQAPRLIPWMVEPGEALTLEARFRIVRHPDLHTLAPFIDRYGQCRYADWPGKVTSDQELRFADEEEDRRLAGWGEPSEYDRYGGYRWAGWEEEATGFYRLARRQGYWWLVTPEGNPCFYVGLCSAPALRWEQTPVTEREFLFEWLPPQEGPYAACWDRNQWGVRDGTRYLAMHTANLIRKYGEDWIQQALQRTLRRLRAWGFSGVGKWGAPPATPCLPVLSYWGVPKLVRHPDVFDPQVQGRFREELRAQIEPRRDDPWVVGWSLGNEFDEIVTQDEIREVLRKPAETPAKRALVDFARERLYGGDAARLAQAWNVDAGGRAELDAPLLQPPPEDLEALRRFYAERYYAFIYRTVKEIDPNHLYLGFWIVPGWWENEEDWRLIAPHCDVIGYDRYGDTFSDAFVQRLFERTDKPVLCGEYSFPSWYGGGRGFGLYGPASSDDEVQAGESYRRWVEEAARNPYCIGVCWFQYRDQPLTGRGPGRGPRLVHGEHYAFGLVDITDRPKWGLVERAREANLRAAGWRVEAMAR